MVFLVLSICTVPAQQRDCVASDTPVKQKSTSAVFVMLTFNTPVFLTTPFAGL